MTHQTAGTRDAWLMRIRDLRRNGRTLDEARAIAGPMPVHSDAELDHLAAVITYGVLLAAVAEHGRTREALAAATITIARTDAIAREDGDHAGGPR